MTALIVLNFLPSYHITLGFLIVLQLIANLAIVLSTLNSVLDTRMKEQLLYLPGWCCVRRQLDVEAVPFSKSERHSKNDTDNISSNKIVDELLKVATAAFI